jgi:hypothetical protein
MNHSAYPAALDMMLASAAAELASAAPTGGLRPRRSHVETTTAAQG